MTTKNSIVLVDNHDGMRAIMSNWLSANFPFCDIHETKTGEDCVAMVQARRPIIVLTELCLPGIDGIETTRRIKAYDPEIPVVILTLDENSASRADAQKAGAMAYVVKYRINTYLMPILKELFPCGTEEKNQNN